MSEERDLLKEFIDFVDSYEFYPTERNIIWEIVSRTQELLAQHEQEPEEGVYQKLLRIEDGVEVEILPSELWQDGYEAGKRSVLLSKQPEQHGTQYLLDQVARLTAENAMLKEKWSTSKQPEQEPTAWMWEDKRNETNSWATVFSPVKPDNSVHVKNVVLLYTKEKLEDINGISLRDHFAGLAMQTLPKEIPDMETLARMSYNMADAMLAEREKNENRT